MRPSGSTIGPAMLALLALCLLSVPGASSLAGPIAPLVNPLSSLRAPLTRQITSPPLECRAVPPVDGVMGVSRYIDGNSTVVSAARDRQSRAAAAPANALALAVNAQTLRYLSSGRQDVRRAACAVQLLDVWARADAFKGPFNEVGLAHRRWVINAVSVDFLAVKDAPGIEPDARARVTAWLDRQGDAIVETIGDSSNNHLYWGAAAAAATAVASGNHDRLEWAIRQARRGLSEVRDDGTLPRELRRKQFALTYHTFALEPLVQVAGLAHANGVDLLSANDGAIGRLVRLVATSIGDPQVMARLAGATQGEPYPGSWGWVPQYVALTRDCSLVRRIPARSTFSRAYLGGDTALLYGSPDALCR